MYPGISHTRMLVLALLLAGTSAFAQKDDDPLAAERLDWSSAKIDGKAFMIATQHTIEKRFGKPDSTAEFDADDECASFIDRHHWHVYYHGAEFEKYSDSLVFMKMSFPAAGKHSLRFGKMQFNTNTTLDDLKKKFPTVSASIDKRTENGKTYEIIYVPLTDKNSDDSYAFYFENGKLVMIRYWMPC